MQHVVKSIDQLFVLGIGTVSANAVYQSTGVSRVVFRNKGL